MRLADARIDADGTCLIAVTPDELRWIKSCANETLEALDHWDFETRVGATSDEIKSLVIDADRASRALQLNRHPYLATYTPIGRPLVGTYRPMLRVVDDAQQPVGAGWRSCVVEEPALRRVEAGDTAEVHVWIPLEDEGFATELAAHHSFEVSADGVDIIGRGAFNRTSLASGPRDHS